MGKRDECGEDCSCRHPESVTVDEKRTLLKVTTTVTLSLKEKTPWMPSLSMYCTSQPATYHKPSVSDLAAFVEAAQAEGCTGDVEVGQSYLTTTRPGGRRG